jgi:hypothetical protein
MNIRNLSIATASSAVFLLGVPAHAGHGTAWDYKNYPEVGWEVPGRGFVGFCAIWAVMHVRVCTLLH